VLLPSSVEQHEERLSRQYCDSGAYATDPDRQMSRMSAARIRAKLEGKINANFSLDVTTWRSLEQLIYLAMRFTTPKSSAVFSICAALILSACASPGKDVNSAGSSASAATAAVASPNTTRHLETGQASWYGRRFHGRTTASGAPFDMNAMTAAHRTLPFGTKVKVTNMANGRAVTVTINDRGPFVRGRVIDLSRGAAAKLDFLDAGVTKVRMEVEG
jgi:rare lipoprotein A